MTNPRIMFYHDGRHPLIYMYEPPIQKEEYEAGVDELIGTPVDAIMFGLGDMSAGGMHHLSMLHAPIGVLMFMRLWMMTKAFPSE